MSYNLTEEVREIGSLNFEGNIIPVEWINSIRLPTNKPDLISIFLLSDIVYWYRPTTIRDEFSSKIIGYKKKFKADLLQKGYKDLEDLFGLSAKQTREAFIRLENLGLIKRIFRTIESNGTKLSNVMFIQIFPKEIARITSNTLFPKKETPYLPKEKQLVPSVEIAPSQKGNTYTKTTTNNSFSLSSSISKKQIKKVSEDFSELNEREKEMLEIWNEIIEEKNEAKVQLTSKRAKLLDLCLTKIFKGDIDQWKQLCLKIASSKFLMGEITNFKIKLDWILKEENLLKILENNYVMGDRQVIEANIPIDITEEIISDPLWKQTREELKKQLGEGIFNSWIAKLGFEGIEEQTACLLAPTKFIKEWIMNNYCENIKKSFNKYGTNIQEILIQLKYENDRRAKY